MAKVRVLMFHPALAPYRVDLFNRLRDKLDFKVAFLNDGIHYHRDLNQNNLKNLLKCDYEFLRGGLAVAGRDFRTGIWRTIRRVRPNVVVTTEFSFTTLAVLFYKRCLAGNRFGLTVATAENPRILEQKRGIRDMLSRMGSSAADSMLVYTEAMKHAYADRGAAEEKLFVCANHQDEKRFLEKLETARELVRQTVREYGLAGRKVLLFVGRLDEKKALDNVIRAFAAANGSVRDSVLVLAGGGPQRQRLESLAAARGVGDGVLFLGHREGSELLVWYLLAGAFVLASRWECYGAVVNEALLAGVPVLCSSHAGANVLIRQGRNGHVFDPCDIDTLTGLMSRAMSEGPTAEAAGEARRENLMPVPFERDVTSFVRAVQYAAAQVGVGKSRRELTA